LAFAAAAPRHRRNGLNRPLAETGKAPFGASKRGRGVGTDLNSQSDRGKMTQTPGRGPYTRTRPAG